MICYTSSGINFFLHTCGGKLSKFSFLQSEAVCGMEQSSSAYLFNHHPSLNQTDNCCQNHAVKTFLKVRNIEKLNKDDHQITAKVAPLHFDSFQKASKASYPYYNVFSGLHRLTHHPILKDEIYLLLQNFRN
ncbi:MAG: hypothetical protein KKG25_08655 [Bacteroidetes bacterium]|nr:hypothetical protein [Bacteroidota bacterium]MBU1484907.1 hypothetical protein [Bacteroidota bacterium]MBU2266493.1 hypothetical protein [Bacteroidota bacterium]